jgi:hypothetical protein
MTAQKPAADRIENVLAFLRDNGPAHTQDIAEAVFTVRRNAQRIVNLLLDAGKIHVGAWLRSTGAGQRGRVPTRLWAYGPGEDAPRPVNDDCKTILARRKARLRKLYGRDYIKVLRSRSSGGASVLSRDGEVIYRRAPASGRNGHYARKES